MATKYDDIIKKEEKNISSNPFNKARENVKGADNNTDVIENKNESNSNQGIDINKTINVSEIFNNYPKKKEMQAKSYYLSNANIRKLERIAKMQKISDSKALNKILDSISLD